MKDDLIAKCNQVIEECQSLIKQHNDIENDTHIKIGEYGLPLDRINHLNNMIMESRDKVIELEDKKEAAIETKDNLLDDQQMS